MSYMLIRHKIKDYNKWKPLFDKNGVHRKASGSKGGYLLRNADNSNEIVALFKWDDLTKARQFAQSDELKQAMQEAGVSDKPDVYFLDEVEQPVV